MVVLIFGSSHSGKTLLAQKILEKYGYPYLSIDHLKMGLIRSKNTELTPEDDDKLTEYLWPIAREMAKTAIENQTAIEKAEAGKQVAVLKAEAKAEQVRIAAEAEADANRMIQESLTDSLIEKKKVEAWDGKLPAVVGSGTLVGLDAFTDEK